MSVFRGGVINSIVYSVVKGYWFLWAYLALTMVSPILNIAAEGDVESVNKRLIPLVVIVFGWSFMAHVPYLNKFVPQTAGVSALSFVMMSAVYVTARVIRKRRYDELYFSGYPFWLMFVASIPICWMGFSHYDSIFSLIVSIGLFQIVRKINLPVGVSRLILLIAPSMFSVYILHQTYRGFDFVGMGMRASNFLADGYPNMATFIAACIVFTSCVLIDLLRRAGQKAICHGSHVFRSVISTKCEI